MGNRENKTTTQVNQPGFVEESAKNYMRELENAWGQSQAQPYQGRYLANSPELWGTASKMNQLGRTLDREGGGKQLGQLAQSTIAGDFLHAGANPYLADYIQMAQDPITKNYESVVRPGADSANVLGGSFDNLRNAYEDAQLRKDYTQQMTDVGTNIGMANYGAERQLQANAGDMLQQSMLMRAAPIEMQAQSGQMLQNLRQREIDNTMAQRNQPWQDLGLYSAGLSPIAAMYGGGMTQTSPGGSYLGGGIQGALGGAAMGGMTGNPLLALLGGVAGGAGGVLG